MHNQRVLRDVANTDCLQGISLLVTRQKRLAGIAASEADDRLPGVSCKRRDILRLTLDEYVAQAEELTCGFERAARFLHRERI